MLAGQHGLLQPVLNPVNAAASNAAGLLTTIGQQAGLDGTGHAITGLAGTVTGLLAMVTAVSVAVAQLMVRPVRPADCKSFLRKQLKNATEGSDAVQRARQQRIKVPL